MYPSYEYILLAFLCAGLGWHGAKWCNWIIEYVVMWIFKIEIDSGDGEQDMIRLIFGIILLVATYIALAHGVTYKGTNYSVQASENKGIELIEKQVN